MTPSSIVYNSLLAESLSGKVAFHLSSDALPCLPPSSTPSLLSPHPFFADISPCAFRAAVTAIDIKPSAQNMWIQESVVTHVNGDLAWVRRPVHLDYPEPPHATSTRRSSMTGASDGTTLTYTTDATVGSLIDLDEPLGDWATDGGDDSSTALTLRDARADDCGLQSPWVPAYGNLNWMIHRIARLLSRSKPGVVIFLTVIRMGACRDEAAVKSAEHLDFLRKQQTWGSAERQAITEAQRFAENSSEVLFYGKVGDEACVGRFEWSKEHIPVDLPRYFFKQRSEGVGSSWISRLLWDSPRTPFALAEVMLEDSRHGRLLRRGAGP